MGEYHGDEREIAQEMLEKTEEKYEAESNDFKECLDE